MKLKHDKLLSNFAFNFKSAPLHSGMWYNTGNGGFTDGKGTWWGGAG